jgi:hypothetical protein
MTDSIYLIDSTVEYDSWFSNSSWTEGYVAFVKGRENAFECCEKIVDKMLIETTDHRSQIRGSWKKRLIIGIIQGISSYDEIEKDNTLDIIFHSALGNDFLKSHITDGKVVDSGIPIEAFIGGAEMGIDNRAEIVKYDSEKGEFVPFEISQSLENVVDSE